jgi:hypothetical protein
MRDQGRRRGPTGTIRDASLRRIATDAYLLVQLVIRREATDFRKRELARLAVVGSLDAEGRHGCRCDGSWVSGEGPGGR